MTRTRMTEYHVSRALLGMGTHAPEMTQHSQKKQKSHRLRTCSHVGLLTLLAKSASGP
jgi:hypothetical protein